MFLSCIFSAPDYTSTAAFLPAGVSNELMNRACLVTRRTSAFC